MNSGKSLESWRDQDTGFLGFLEAISTFPESQEPHNWIVNDGSALRNKSIMHCTTNIMVSDSSFIFHNDFLSFPLIFLLILLL